MTELEHEERVAGWVLVAAIIATSLELLVGLALLVLTSVA